MSKTIYEKMIIFVGGAPRSGTTLVQRLLDSHPDIVGGPELNSLLEIISLLSEMESNIHAKKINFYFDVEQLENIFRNFIDSIFKYVKDKYNVQLISEKTPQNVLVFDKLAQLFPEAKFVFVIRDPKAIMASYRKVKLNALKKGKKPPLANRNLFRSLDDIYKHVQLGCLFCKKNPSISYIIKYENLVNDPTNEMKNLLNFLGLPFTSDVLKMQGESEKYVENRIIQGESFYYSKGDLSRNIDNKNIEKWKNVLSLKESRLINRVFYEILAKDYTLGDVEQNRGTWTYELLYRMHRKTLSSKSIFAKIYGKLI